MTINLDDLKKIQLLFEGWNNSDRALKYGRVYYVAGKIDHQLFRFNCILNSTLDEYSRGDDFLHYPYPHQMWEKVNWRLFEKREITGDGKLWIRPVNEKQGWNLDTETALLKALVWQIEQERK